MKIFFNEKPKWYVGDYPSITIHYREGKRHDAELLASKLRDIAQQENTAECQDHTCRNMAKHEGKYVGCCSPKSDCFIR